MPKKKEELLPLVRNLDAVIAAAQEAGLTETVALLRMARLDFLMRVGGIRASELELLSYALQRGLEQDDPDEAVAKAAPVKPGKAKSAKPRTRLKA